MHCILHLLALSAVSWAQSAIPPSTFPELSSTVTSALAGSTSLSGSTTLSASANSTSAPTQTSSAQFPSLSGYPSCVSDCLATAVSQANCTSLVEVNCFCANNRFSSNFQTCLLAGGNCTTEVPSAESLAQQFCNLSNTTRSLSFPPLPATVSSRLSTITPTIPPSAASGATTNTTANSAPSSNFRSILGAERGSYTGAVITVLGLMIGVYMVD